MREMDKQSTPIDGLHSFPTFAQGGQHIPGAPCRHEKLNNICQN